MTSTGTAQLTRAEEAYAHLASFKRGDAVDVAGEEFFLPGTVVAPLRADGGDMASAFLVICGSGVVEWITVSALLAGKRTVTSLADAKAGNVRYFDPAGYAAQNG